MTIVVGYSPQPHGEEALRAAIDLALDKDEDLVVVNTTRGDAYADPRYARAQDVQRVKRQLADAGVRFDLRQSVVAEGAASAILEAASQREVTLIVIGVRHRSAVGKLIMGSVAQTVILDSRVPVLSVKASADA
jgi:nucleotide-binding universal stress UspA family protein